MKPDIVERLRKFISQEAKDAIDEITRLRGDLYAAKATLRAGAYPSDYVPPKPPLGFVPTAATNAAPRVLDSARAKPVKSELEPAFAACHANADGWTDWHGHKSVELANHYWQSMRLKELPPNVITLTAIILDVLRKHTGLLPTRGHAMRETPRTDVEEELWAGQDVALDRMTEFARELERELATATAGTLGVCFFCSQMMDAHEVGCPQSPPILEPKRTD